LGDAMENMQLARVEASLANYDQARDQLRSLSLTPIEEYERIVVHVDEAITSIDALILHNQDQMNELLETVNAQNEAATMISLLLMVAGVAILCFLISVVALNVIRPLTHLSEVIADFGERPEPRAEASGVLEIREIASQFNTMADKLEERKRDMLQFVASVAHDLRNPLAALL